MNYDFFYVRRTWCAI